MSRETPLVGSVGNLPPGIPEREVEDEVCLSSSAFHGCLHKFWNTAEVMIVVLQFIRFGTLRSVWIARKPPGFGELTKSAYKQAFSISQVEFQP